MSAILLVITAATIVLGKFTPPPQKLRWRDLQAPSELITGHPAPAGLAGGNLQYVCRSHVDNNNQGNKRYVPGGLILAGGQVLCIVADENKQKNQRDFQMLTGRQESYSWVYPPSRNRAPNYAIPSGVSVDGTTVYVCRGPYANGMIVGNYYPPTGNCYVAMDNLHLIISYDYEVLVLNQLGLIFKGRPDT